jgi:Fe-S-cluster-containing dehydrogenase component
MKVEKAHKFGMFIDLDKCTGCGSCMVACMAENNVPFREDETDKLISVAWMRVYQLSNDKPFPDTETSFLPRPCQHCEGHHGHSPCVSVCPATATDYDANTGIVSQIYTRCFGCRYCMAACPYHVRLFNWYDPVWPEGMEKSLNPNISVRMRGVVEKCSFCFHRYQLAKQRADYIGDEHLAEDAYQTACTQACPAKAIVFGDLNNPDHKVHQLAQPDSRNGGKPRAKNVFRLLEHLGTNPKVYYHSSKEWVRRLGDNDVTDRNKA